MVKHTLATDVAFKLKLDGVATNDTLIYSANAYLYRIGSGNNNLAVLARALYAYGEAAKEYTK